MFRRILRHTIWAPDAIPVEEFAYRKLKRVYLPLFDVLGVLIAYLAIQYGSRILNELYEAYVIDLIGWGFGVASVEALVGVIFPRLWGLEIAGKLVMMVLLGTYSATIWGQFISGNVQGGFVAAILLLPLVLPLFRLDLLGEEIKQRRTAHSE